MSEQAKSAIGYLSNSWASNVTVGYIYRKTCDGRRH